MLYWPRRLNMTADHLESLLGEYSEVRKGWHPDYTSWRVFHALSFMVGGTTFIAGEGACVLVANSLTGLSRH